MDLTERNMGVRLQRFSLLVENGTVTMWLGTDGLPKAMPALSYAQSIQDRAARMGFDWEDYRSVIDKLADQGFDPVYGARPLKRVIQTQLENPLAQAILGGKLGQQVQVSEQDDEIRLHS